MADKERDSMLREMAQHRGLKLVRSRRRKPGGDFGLYGLKAVASGEECLGFGKKGLAATADEVEAFLRQQTTSTWKKSLGAVPPKERVAIDSGKSRASRKGSSPPPPPPSKAPASAPTPAPAVSASRRSGRESKELKKPELRIREADSVDSEAIARLISDFAPTSAEEAAGRLLVLAHGGERPLVARLGNDVVGLITWHVTPVLHRPQPVGRITFLQVDENFRRQGIARRLVEAVAERLSRSGCGALEVTSHIKRAGVHKFYGKLGFERTSYRFAKPLVKGSKD